MKVAIVHDWLTGMRGGEKVVECICELFPEADLFTLVYVKENISQTINSHKIVPSFIDSLPFGRKHYKLYLPFFPLAIESFDLSDYDLILSSSTCVAKGVITNSTSKHICYCNTPMRYAWEFRNLYTRSLRPRWLLAPVFSLVLSYLRMWDVATALRPDHFIANSQNIARRIKSHYGLSSSVVFPPVDSSFFFPSEQEPHDYWFVLSAMVPYKKLEIAIEAFNESGRKLKIAGDGSERKKLEKMAASNIEFLGRVNDDEVLSLLQNARGLIFPGEEDFGITPLEANACGRPVVAYKAGGVIETQTEFTASFFDEQTAESLNSAVEIANSREFDSLAIRKHAEGFARSVFKEEYMKVVNAVLKERKV